MALYAVGDLQGCLHPLERLLEYVNFDPAVDTLWLTGDLVCRGPDSIGSLQFVRSLAASAKTVLGNHDLHLLACFDTGKIKPGSEIDGILNHPDAPELMDWLARQPMLIQDETRGLMMTHAGIPPQWSDDKAIRRARELETCLADKTSRSDFFKAMYGNKPSSWSGKLTGNERLRYIVNAFTRMRFCGQGGELEFKFDKSPDKGPIGMKPWYEWPAHKRSHKLIFGHWAALMGMTRKANFISLDSGYVWGNYLTLMNLDSDIRFCCDTNGHISEIHESDFLTLKRPL
ncbi:symmetrical bis(5'-nucleosyl)-tetraphosphatase [Reinekea marinisedimentorum]|uniref:bis(5'-nucleosyl)-tetraphosphatase (symmetrical) n=1 Tax=Reinekea marinisedimentorum TaxID=230495 RepID=A0A4R3HX23_9GAMM|nr:symmetrical bis(5'-nucleosyl)-tetraphosphatase [Reinekea marinisedimentorum]TCS37153.1 bis(5'-nucleosyl)-tetraphosphatase (symmetrical) [Reinekea marinisedimentorum]